MFTPTQIDGMTGDTLQRAIAKILDAGLVDQQDTNQKYEDSLSLAQAADSRVGLALERIAGALEAANHKQLNKAQQAFLQVYEMCLAIRKSSLTTSTTDATHQDIVSDAAKMAVFVWPMLKAELIAQELPPGALDWN